MASNPIESSTSTFLGMGLKVGDRMQLDPPAKITGGARVVRLVGYTEDRSLLVSMPDEKNWSGSLIEGDTVLIRTFSAGPVAARRRPAGPSRHARPGQRASSARGTAGAHHQ